MSHRSVAPYKGSEDKAYAERGGQFYSSDPKCLKGAKQADEAMTMSHTDRLGTFLVELLSSEESEEEEAPEPMQFNGKEILDACVSQFISFTYKSVPLLNNLLE
jgi:hypothetical protein